MKRLIDMTILILLGLVLVRGMIMARESPDGPPLGIALLQEGDAPGTLSQAGAAQQIVTNQIAVYGEIWTIEDLARAAHLLESGGIASVAPLSKESKKEVMQGLMMANESRQKLTKIQAEIRTTEDALTQTARKMVATLTAEQREWILTNRDRISVSEVEQRYWDALLGRAAQ